MQITAIIILITIYADSKTLGLLRTDVVQR